MADAKPQNQALAVLNQLKELWGKQSKGRKIAAMAVVAGIVAIVAVTQLASKSQGWVAVGEGASPDDTQELYSLLTAQNVPVRLKDGKLEVDSKAVTQARAIASAAGLPRGGKGFELFDGSSLGQSSFTEQVNYKRALQGELARSITSMAQIQSARVQIAFGKKSVFKDADEAASASISLQLHPGQTLTGDQVRGVRALVAAAVEGLKADAVVIVDQRGNLLDGTAAGSGDRKNDLEQSLTVRVRTMLEKVVGPGKVSVVTTAAVDDRKLSETQEIYDQEKPVLRNEARTLDGEAATNANIGGLAGTRGNLPGAAAATPAPGTGGNSRVQETKNYEVNRTVRQVVKPDIQLQRLNVAIVVDNKTGPDGKGMPRTKEEMAELTALARQAAGIDDTRGDKIEVRNIAFAADADNAAVAAAGEPAGELPIIPIAAGAGGLIVAAMIFMMLKKKKTAQVEAAKEIEKVRPSLALPLPIAELERALEARPTSNSLDELPAAPEMPALPPGKPVRERVLEVVRNDAERAAEVLTAWLSETAASAGAKR